MTSPSESTPAPLGWWSISGDAMLAAFRRAAAGEDPDLLYAELYANCTVEPVPPDADSPPDSLPSA